ncbi:MAG: ATP-binding protein [Verrucomicrobia bacterium]|nr:ATP-binding protein [Verrucomicrobiota bacterium]
MDRTLLKKLVEWKNNPSRKPLILQGARQVGKTTLLKLFGNGYFPAVHTFNFEKDLGLATHFEKNIAPQVLLQELEYYLGRPIDRMRDLVIFDEIQACPRALTSLKYFQEEMPELALCAAGSLLGIYLGPVSFPVGKVDMMTLYPMTFQEFLNACGKRQLLELVEHLTLHDKIPEAAHHRLFEQLKMYFVTGGLPEVVKTYCEEQESSFTAFIKVREKQNTLIETYLADIAKHSGKVNAMHIARVLQSIPSKLDRCEDGSASKYTFKDVIPGVDRYSRLASAIDWLEAAKLIIKTPIVNSGNIPFSSHAQENTFKLYLLDVGLLGAMSNLSPQVILKYDYGSYKGYFAENFVAQALLTTPLRRLYSWQENLAQVEFLYEEEGEAIPIEVKSGWVTHAKSTKIFAKKYNSPYRIIFSAKPLAANHELHSYPLYLAEQFPLRPHR